MIMLDTSLIFSVFAEDNPNHKVAQGIFRNILNGDYGQPIIIDYVFNELLTLIYVRTKRFSICSQVETFIDKYVKKGTIRFVHTPNDIFWKANQTFLHQDLGNQTRFLSFTDSIIGEMAEWLIAGFIGTFDNQFHRFSQQIVDGS